MDTKTNPNYRKVIKKPIDLNIIRTRYSKNIGDAMQVVGDTLRRIDESLYKSKDEYMADVDLMYCWSWLQA